MKNLKSKSVLILTVISFLLSFFSCETNKVKKINIGYIGPLSQRATDLGIAPSNALKLAVEQYNETRPSDAPEVNLYIEDGQWNKDKAIPAYDKLREEHNIDILFISNTDGTVAIQDKILKDKVIIINPLNNDALLASLNENTFTIAKSTEEANGLIGMRLIELHHKKVALFHYPNDFMTRAANEVKRLLDEENIEIKIIKTEIGAIDYTSQLKQLKSENYDAYVFFGYKEYGFAMKQARDMGIKAPFFGSTVLLDPEFYRNSQGAIIGTEYPFFTTSDGNYILAKEFLEDYLGRFGNAPSSIWPPMQAYDAMNIVLQQIKTANQTKAKNEHLSDWLRKSLHNVNYYQGVCGNIAILKDGSSRGIYFSLYYFSDGLNPVSKVKR